MPRRGERQRVAIVSSEMFLRRSGLGMVSEIVSISATNASEVSPAPPEALAGDLCWMLSRTSHSLTTELTAALEGSGLSPRSHQVLATALTGEHTQTELASIIGIDKTTMMVTLDELERAGLAERLPLKTDRRARVIRVTRAGGKLVRDLEAVFDGVREDILRVLPRDEREIFLRSLARLACGRLAAPVPCSHPVRRHG